MAHSLIHVNTPIPEEYYTLSDGELETRIRAARAKLGEDLVILGHHYQGARVIEYADFTGDSFKLAQAAQTKDRAKYIIFCGVHFMAETADILSKPDQVVILPDMGAGCSMADMANEEQVDIAWQMLMDRFGETGPSGKQSFVPITYMNSTAALKAFCGQNNGAVCTSSNAEGILKWAFDRGERVLFFPDQHLGRNTGHKMGIPLEQMVVYNPITEEFEADDDAVDNAKIILWKGFCSVHQKFTPQQIDAMRVQHPGINIIVHPECRFEVVQKADLVGSTEYIIQQVSKGEPGSVWAVGTEINLVHRLAEQHPDKLILSLSGPNVCPCATMYRISPQHLCWAMENLATGEVVNQVSVPDEVRHWANVSLDRMLKILK